MLTRPDVLPGEDKKPAAAPSPNVRRRLLVVGLWVLALTLGLACFLMLGAHLAAGAAGGRGGG